MATDRVQLNSQTTTLPFMITQPGSYVLTSNLTAVSNAPGIIITADNVTLDLNGFTLDGAGMGVFGVSIAIGTPRNVTVRNGTISGWTLFGINAPVGIATRLTDLNIYCTTASASGAYLGTSSFASGLNIRGSAGSSSFGLNVGGSDNRIDACHVTSFETGYYVGGPDNLIVRNSGSANGIDYTFVAGNAYGPIVVVGGAGDITSVPNADHPWANFALSCAPTAEVCDGMDNDCNAGTPDGSGDPQNGAACDGADADLCAEGTFSCVAGVLTCSDVTGDNIEVCDNVDNDCDMSVDEGVNCGPNATCAGSCVCNIGFANCNGNQIDGCEVNTVTDPNNCGFCGFACPGGAVCISSMCKLPNGASCTVGSQCQSNFCVDNVCCNAPCTGLCQACTAALKGSGSNGTCGNIASGTDPQNECSSFPNFNCNGSGGCGP